MTTPTLTSLGQRIKNTYSTTCKPVGMALGALSLLLSSHTLMAAPIYKVVDEAGHVTYTDKPDSYGQAGQSVSMTSINTVGEHPRPQAVDSTKGEPNFPPAAVQTDAQVKTNYQLSIMEPSTERAYQRPAQNIDIVLQVTPQLKRGAKINISIDGNVRTEGLSLSVPTVDLTPGPHTITAQVIDGTGEVRATATRTVHVIQNTMLLQQKKQAAKLTEQLLAYERLPWHQKLLVRMKGNDTVNQ